VLLAGDDAGSVWLYDMESCLSGAKTMDKHDIEQTQVNEKHVIYIFYYFTWNGNNIQRYTKQTKKKETTYNDRITITYTYTHYNTVALLNNTNKRCLHVI